MPKCFCGCDLPVKGFASRGQNKQGRRTVEQLDKLKALQERCRNLSQEYGEFEGILPGTNIGAHGKNDSAEALENLAGLLDRMIEPGEEYAEEWHDILHYDHIPVQGAMAYKKEWLDWGKPVMRVTPMLKKSDEDLTVFALHLRDADGLAA